MGLLVKQNGEKTITIKGTAINLPEVYLRVAFGANIDGRTCEAAFYSFATELMFIEGKPIYTDVPTANVFIVVDANEIQSIDVVLSHLKTYYETELGYIAEVV